MQVNHSLVSNQYPSVSKVKPDSHSSPANNSVQPDKVTLNADVQKEAHQGRFSADPQAIALVEKETKSAQSFSSNTSYDQPSHQNKNAVAVYQSVNNQAQRDTVQSAFGVDLFA